MTTWPMIERAAIHQWRENPSPEQMNRVIVCGDALSGFALELERALLLALGEAPETAEDVATSAREQSLAKLCTCGHIGSFHVPNCLGVRNSIPCTCLGFEEPEA